MRAIRKTSRAEIGNVCEREPTGISVVFNETVGNCNIIQDRTKIVNLSNYKDSSHRCSNETVTRAKSTFQQVEFSNDFTLAKLFANRSQSFVKTTGLRRRI